MPGGHSYDQCACGGRKQKTSLKCDECARGRKEQTAAPDSDSSFTVSGDRGELKQKVNRDIRTLDELIVACKIDTSVWEVEKFVCNKWSMAAMPKTVGSSKNWQRESTEPIITPIFQVKAWLKRKVAVIAARDEIATLIADAKKFIPRRAPAIRTTGLKTPSGNMLEVSIPDLHLGKLAWAPETGHAHYDIKTAVKLYEAALEALIARTSQCKFDRVLLVLGNDLLHSDTKQGTTTAGTQLDTDSRFHKSFLEARRMVTRAIERLRPIAPVTAAMVQGNHDNLSVWHLGDSLECFYHNATDVEILNSPNTRKYVQFGRVMLLLTHGDKGKLKDLPLLMATEQPKMFGETLHREAHVGHRHQLEVQEHRGIKIRTSPALCPPDAWHAENLFVGNARAAEAFVWHREEGLIAQATYTVQPSSDAAAA